MDERNPKPTGGIKRKEGWLTLQPRLEDARMTAALLDPELSSFFLSSLTNTQAAGSRCASSPPPDLGSPRCQQHNLIKGL